MCGIAGILTGPGGRPAAFDELERMAATLHHRGPDGWGLYRDDRIGLAHTRLSIVGLTNGSQPLCNEDGTVWTVFNGEVFNHRDLRRQLQARGHRFDTDTDTEVIVHGYEEYGPDLWPRLNGQFAFALWDRRARRLWLVRDRFGILPLHVARAGGTLLFASEAKALFASGRLTPRLDPAGLAQVFTTWAAIAPATVFQDVRSVRPGCALCLDADLTETEHRHWQPSPVPDPDLHDLPVAEAADRLEAHLSRSVELRLQADVPVGAYLSGGLDSSVIAALGQRYGGGALRTFSVRFTDPAFDETDEQRQAVAATGTRHHDILCDPAAIRDHLAAVVWHCETPLLRSAGVPLFLLSGLVRDHGLKVVLTGEGADELLAGYNIFKEDRIRRFWARQPDSHARAALLGRLYAYVGSQDQRDGAVWRRFFGRHLADLDHPFYSHLIRWEGTAWTQRFLAPELRNTFDLDCLADILDADLPAGWRGWDPLARAQLIEMHGFMSSFLLSCQGDRVAMGNGVEARYPFLDPEVADFCFALPPRLKLLGLREKTTLRALAARHLPADIARRPKKPYRAPIGPMLFGDGGTGWIDDLLSDRALRRLGLADPEPARRLVAKARRQRGRMNSEREERALLGLLTLQILGHQFLEAFPDHVAAHGRAWNGTAPSVRIDQAEGPINRAATEQGMR